MLRNQDDRVVPEFLMGAIKREIERAAEEEIEEAKKRIEKRKSEIIAGIVLHVHRMVQMETTDHKLIITVRHDD